MYSRVVPQANEHMLIYVCCIRHNFSFLNTDFVGSINTRIVCLILSTIYSFLTKLGLESIINHTRGKHTYHYTTNWVTHHTAIQERALCFIYEDYENLLKKSKYNGI
jgi:hypothetical protein